MPRYDTIAAISTPFGTGAIAVIRISGPGAFSIASGIFSGSIPFEDIKSHRASYGKISDPKTGDVVDHAILIKYKAPFSFTGEDTIEISCHGGLLIQKEILQISVRMGARPAQPGEFTKRAFLNGRIDLSQAEAVMDLINSKTQKSIKAAIHQLEGALSKRLEEITGRLVKLIAHINASLDFPEYDIDEITRQDVLKEISEVKNMINHLLDNFEKGRILREGISIVIMGRPNVGKSSLLNRLIGKNRAIVSDIPGTTRDILDEYINIREIPVRLVDTAGIRETEDRVEIFGLEKAWEEINNADLVLFMTLACEPFNKEEKKMIEKLEGKKLILVINKTDLAVEEAIIPSYIKAPAVKTSILKETGIEELEEEIEKCFYKDGMEEQDEILLTNVRHRHLLEKAFQSLEMASDSCVTGMPMDIAAIDINEAVLHTGAITGESVEERIMDSIFSNFCIGK